MTDDHDCLPHNRDIVMKDWETGFAMYTKHVAQITALRGWTLTLLLAYLGFLMGIRHFDWYLQVPMGFVIGGFLILELFEGASMQLVSRRTHRIEQIFANPDPDAQNHVLQRYRFRDLELSDCTYVDRLSWAMAHLKNPKVIFWYCFVLLFAFGTFHLFKANVS
jgi:hypothetical protein